MSKAKKAIRFQIDMIYIVPEDLSNQYFERDREFFESIKSSFHKWEENPEEVRIPQQFELRYHIGDVKEDE